MPTYDYQCENCGLFELLQSMKDEPLEVCPKCGGKAARQFSTNVNFVFKGSGFYITDYTRNDDYKKKAAEEGKAPAAKPDKESPAAPAAPSSPAAGAAPAASPAPAPAPSPAPGGTSQPKSAN